MSTTANTTYIAAETIRIGHVLVSKTGATIRVTSANTAIDPNTRKLIPTQRTIIGRDAQGVTRRVNVTFGKKIRVRA